MLHYNDTSHEDDECIEKYLHVPHVEFEALRKLPKY